MNSQPRALALANASTSASRSSTSLITSAVTVLSDPAPKQVDAHLLEFLTAEARPSSPMPSTFVHLNASATPQVIRHIIDSETAARSRRAAHEKLVEANLAASALSSQAGLSVENAAAQMEEVDEGSG